MSLVLKKIPGMEKDWLRRDIKERAKEYGLNNVLRAVCDIVRTSDESNEKDWFKIREKLEGVLEKMEEKL